MGKLWEQGIEGLDRCNKINKVEPMNRAITELKATAWISDSGAPKRRRKDLPVLAKQNKITKITPSSIGMTKLFTNILARTIYPITPSGKKAMCP